MKSEILDGRVERRKVSKKKIIDYTRKLMIEGYAEPTAEQIAARTGLTTRTLFRHFPDMESLYLEVLSEAQKLAHAVMDEPMPPGSPSEQLLHVVDRRARVYEHMLPTQISQTLLQHRSDRAQAYTRSNVKRRRKRLKVILPPEVLADPLLFEAIDGVLSIAFWVNLRRDQQLSAKRAKEVLLCAVQRLVP